MLHRLALILAQADGQAAQVYDLPSYFLPIFSVLMIGGALCWLIAAVIGFGRARAFGPHVRWFALAAACLFLYQIHFLLMSFASISGKGSLAFPLITSLNLFILLGAICAVIGFMKMKATAPANPD